ncbi:MAG: phosphotransferase [Erysipelothrix sp.]|nr:phosphotransferase [Erysipelothrix sp.]
MHTHISKNIPYKIDKIIKTNMGLTNTNYIVEVDNKKYMLRYPKNDVKHLFNPKNEEKVINEMKDLDFVLPVKYYKDGIQMVDYLDNLITFDQADKKTRIKTVAKLMKKFHSSKIKVDFNFNPLEQIQLYKNNIKKTQIDISPYNSVLDKLKHHKFTSVLCHNDWVAGNICFKEDKIFLIDFEYAGNNDPLFDIMSFLTENDLSKEERIEFLNEMFPLGIDKKTEAILTMYRDVNNLLWYLWAMMMDEFRNEAIYREIAQIKIQQLEDEYNTKLWK